MADYNLVLTANEIDRYSLMAKRARIEEADLWAVAGITSGASIVDLGCGPGQTLAEMADVVGEGGQVVGVDTDSAALRAARETLRRRGLTQASVRHGRAERTGLRPSSFDVAVVRHVLAHNGGREKMIVHHAAHLVRPDGYVYLVDVGPTVLRLEPPEPDIDDLIHQYAAFLRSQGNDPHVGLRLVELLEAAGLEVIAAQRFPDVAPSPPGMRPPGWAARTRMMTTGFATATDLDRWGAALSRSDGTIERPILFAPLIAAVGRRRA